MSALAARLDDLVTREPPHNIDAEQELIGAVLVNNAAFLKVSSIVTAEHFFEAMHRQIWEVIAAVIGKGEPATPVTLKTHLGNKDLGGQTVMQYLARLAVDATTVVNAPGYARIVRDMASRRRLIAIGQEMMSTAYESPVDMTAETIFSGIERIMEDERPAITGTKSGFRPMSQISSNGIYEAYKKPGEIVGVPTGYSRLDETLAGFQGSDLIILAARPGMGKTALVTGITVNVAEHVKARRARGEEAGDVAFFSLEMGEEQLKQRIVADRANVPNWKLRRGLASKEEMHRYEENERYIDRLPIYIDEEGGLTIAQIKMRARMMMKRRGITLLVVDYLQLLHGTGRRDNRVAEVTEITTGLKALAKELHIPIIALAQLSRGVEDRDDRRPQLRDLRESGSIEQDADTVLFIYREEYYLAGWKPKEGTPEFDRKQRELRQFSGVAEIIIGKNRHGATGTVELGFEGQFTRFTNEPEPRQIEPEEARQRAAKKPAIGKDGAILYGLLKSLTITRSSIATQDQRSIDSRLCRGARMIPIEDCWRAYGGEVLPGESEDKQKVGFRNAMKNLRAAELARYHGVEETGFFVWVPELAAEV